MKRVYGIIGLGLAGLIATAAVGGQALRQDAPAPVSATADTLGRMVLPTTQALLDGYVRDGKMPGIVAAFGVGDRPTWFVSAGKLATDPGAAQATPDSLWRVYSMTKPVTAMAAMMLIEEGKIGLDDPVSKYIPAFKTMKVATSPETSLASVPAKTPITIRMLLTHTSGLTYNIIAKGALLKEYERLGILPAQVSMSIEPMMRRTRPATLAEFANRVAQAPLIAQPGTAWNYSVGLDVMGRVIEVASGQPFDTFVNTRIFAPLKMTSSYWTVPRNEAGRLATNYAWTADVLAPLDPAATSVYLQPPSFPYGGAGLVASARDYDRFLHMLADEGTLDGVRIMKPETVRLAMSNLLPAGVTFGGVGGATGGAATNATPMGYGAGGSVYLADGPGGMPSKGTYGWGGAAGTIAFVDPVKKVRGTIMVNYFPADRWPVRQEVVRAMAADLSRFKR
ncbi:CubicO group peptidase (beta-lactamase class C family) [Sphingomonas insulae]|uniref:Serine hydrolase domain-containing protein n=1 Tax=Sphingomonas insulae TaxID=424800 RepID=A0ABP3T6Z2_9SPHN|nr:serine hydrolase domain-containing protein [Sphingomonas insulae]NIJ31213.1 CubicO group peptidase (beta-lactamase class C family) [Sphingomonas insulae]